MIIDCLMNLPLLYQAARLTGREEYRSAACSHAKRAQKYLVRPDDTTFHTFYMDVDTGEPRFGRTAQGYSDSSCWARGQAWGVYGLPSASITPGIALSWTRPAACWTTFWPVCRRTGSVTGICASPTGTSHGTVPPPPSCAAVFWSCCATCPDPPPAGSTRPPSTG